MYAVKAERERKNGSVTGRKRNIMAGKAGAPAAALQQTRRAGLNVGDVSINYRTAPAGDTGVVQRKRRAVLGRRVEPYKEDIEGFIAVCKSKEVKNKEEYVEQMIVRGRKNKIQGTDYSLGTPKYEEDRKIYPQSVNVFIKRKIVKEVNKADEYKLRVLNLKKWKIGKNREWLRTGRVTGYDSNIGQQQGEWIGIKHQGQFRLVGLEKIRKKIFDTQTEKAGYPDKRSISGSNREIEIHALKKEKFEGEDEREVYRAAFEKNGKMENENFIAYAVKNLSEESLLIRKQSINSTITERKKLLFPAEAAPTVLAQEIEQLDEANYKFATISSAAGEKVIALPGAEAEKFQEAARTQKSRKNGSEVPEESTGLDVPETLGELAGWAVSDKVENLVTEQR